MNTVAKTSGARAVRDWKLASAYIASTIPRFWFAENLSTIKGTDLDVMVKETEDAAVKQQNARYRAEHTDAYALRRDYRYMTRSRKWLYLRALQGRMDGDYETYWTYAQNNSSAPETEKLPKKNPAQLAEIPFVTLMRLK